MFDIFDLPFMQRAFIAGSVIAILLGILGPFIITRKMSFIGDGVAHASLAAVALGIVLGIAPLPMAIVFSIILALVLFLLDKHTELSQDTSIGIVFVTGMALGVLILQYHTGYAPELISFLFGSILGISSQDVFIIVAMGALLITILAYKHKAFTFLAVDEQGAAISGMNTYLTDALFFILVSASVILSIKLVGIVLLSGLLIIPASASKIMSSSWEQFSIYSVVLSILSVWIGLIVSYVFDWPSGASIIVVAVGLLLISVGIKKAAA